MKLAKKIIMVVLIVVMLAVPIVYIVDSITYKETLEYNLYEISDGIYGYYNIVASAIPAQNYQVVTLYFGGGVYTLKGQVNIHYTESNPRLVWEKTKTVNGDTLDVYIPYGSLEVRPNMTVG